MFITLHSAMAVSVAAAVGVDQPLVAFGLGWLLHYVGDAIPHGDESLGRWAKKSHSPAVRMGLMFLVDLVFLVLALLWCQQQGRLTSVVWAALVGSALPDLLVGLELAVRRKFTGPLAVLHERAHHLIGWEYSPWIGVPLQVVLAAVLWWRIGR
ncbi:MAG: hypothetical protein ABIJ46_02995 [bacterium]